MNTISPLHVDNLKAALTVETNELGASNEVCYLA